MIHVQAEYDTNNGRIEVDAIFGPGEAELAVLTLDIAYHEVRAGILASANGAKHIFGEKKHITSPVTDDLVWCSDCADNHLPNVHTNPLV